MRTLVWALWVAGGCDGSFTPTPPPPGETGVEATCPDGLVAARGASLSFTSFLVDGLAVATGFDADAIVDGVPAACTSADGFVGQLRFTRSGAGYGILSYGVDGLGSRALSGEGARVSFDLYGADFPAIFDEADWQTGTLVVADDGGAVVLEIQGTAVAEGRTLSVLGTVEVVP